MARHRKARRSPNDLLIRATGLVSLIVAATAISKLYGLGLNGPDAPTTVLPYLLALIGFSGTSVGSAMMMLGHHLFDRIVVGPHGPDVPRTLSTPPGRHS